MSKNSKTFQNTSLAAVISDMLKIKSEIQYKIDDIVSNNKENYTIDLIMPSGKIFEGAESVLDIIRFIDGQKTVAEIIDVLSSQNDKVNSKDIEDIINLFNLFNLLIERNVLEKNENCNSVNFNNI